MAEGFVESASCLFQEFAYGDIVNLEPERKGVDEHSDCVGDLEVRAAVADGAEIHLAVVGVTRNHVGDSGQEEVGRSDAQIAAEAGGLFEIGHAHGLADASWLSGFGEIHRDLAGAFTALELTGEEIPGGTETLAVLILDLFFDEAEVGVGLFLWILALQGGADLTDQQVGAAAVEDEVVYIHQKMYGVSGPDYLEAV